MARSFHLPPRIVVIGHALVVGGTGMLRGTSLSLASRARHVSVIARDRRRLQSLVDDAGGAIYALSLDYGDAAKLERGLETAIADLGPIDLVVAWVHSTAPAAPATIAHVVSRGGGTVRFFDVVGSASADPARDEDGREAAIRAAGCVLYRRVILGFVVQAPGSRWLTNDEIATGVTRAIDADAVEMIVGEVSPWSARP